MATDVLLTIAEISATLAALVALASLIRPGDRGALQLYGMVETSILSAAFALLPTVFASGGQLTDAVLRPCALAFLLVWFVSAVRGYRLSASSNASAAFARSDWSLVAATAFAYLAGFGALLLLLSPWLPEHSAVLYSVSVICPLAVSVMILRLLVRGLVLDQ